MSDSTRYYTISQGTFASWFQLNPSHDLCVINDFYLLQSIGPDVTYPDNSVIMPGSFGSYNLKIDKTQATNTKSFFLRAKTRGYKYAE
jgi:hypothetical protein